METERTEGAGLGMEPGWSISEFPFGKMESSEDGRCGDRTPCECTNATDLELYA